MNRDSNLLINEFNMVYDDWMVDGSFEIKKTYAAIDMLKSVGMKYPDVGDEEVDKKIEYLYEKTLTAHQKLVLMLFAEYNFHKVKVEFESTQNMEFPALYGMGNTMFLFYIESMILFARNALDVAATVYSDLIFSKRSDSFNDFSKWVIKSNNLLLENLKQYFKDNGEDGVSAFRLLCGQEKGRALRDIIIHQANVRLEYYEYKENSEKEHLFLLLKDMEPIDIDCFVSNFVDEVEDIFYKTTLCCEKYLQNEI
jgi:hypothetical protein